MLHKITAIKAQKRKKDRVNIYLDGEYAFSLSRITAAWLHIDQDLSEEKIAELKSQDAHEVAYTKTLQRLNHRDYTQAEVRQKLEQNGSPVEVIDYVLRRLDRAGLVDDERFAQNWVENRSEFKPRGRRALAYELRSKGIGQEILEKALDQVDDEQLAYKAATKQMNKYLQLPEPEFRQKMFAFLARRGFSYDTSTQVVDIIWEEQKGNHDENKTSNIPE